VQLPADGAGFGPVQLEVHNPTSGFHGSSTQVSPDAQNMPPFGQR
jgi:hypothetical protein